MKIREQISEFDERKLLEKINQEYADSDIHTKSWKQATKDLASKYLLPFPTEIDKVKIRKVLNNLTIRLATFVSDELQVTNIPASWVLWAETAENCNNVFKANFVSMDIKNKYREALIDDSIQWVGTLVVDGRNNHKQEPIVSYVDSRLTYPDPKNWQDNKMRFFWTKIRKNIYEIENDSAYDQDRIQEVKLANSIDQKEIDRANDNIKWFTTTTLKEWLIELYNHLTIYREEWEEKPSLYLTTYSWDRNELVRIIKMRWLTPAEQADPSEIDFGVKLFRAKPIKWSYAWVSLVDDVWQYQDIETLLTNLQIEQAKVAAVWWKTFINSKLWIDIDDLANNTWAWDVIPFSSADSQVNAQNGILHEPTRPINPITQNTIWVINQLSQEATNISSIVQWQSLSWSQTKAEVQTLQQNINQVLSYMASNYMDSLKWLWESIYRSYAANMSPQRRKEIVVVDSNNKPDTYWFKKNEFISNWDVYIIIKSRAQEDIKKKQDFAVLLSVIWTLKQSVKPWSTQDVMIDRLLIEKSWIRWLDADLIHPYTFDERQAYNNLVMLNRDIELQAKPQAWEDHEVYINIYKSWLDTKAREKAISDREKMLEVERTQTPEVPEVAWQQAWWTARQLWASMLAWEQAAQTPSIADVQA